MDEIIESLKEIGLNGYEAKVYLALLKKYPATGYEVSKLANIPQSRAYDTLKALELANIVTGSNTKPVTYSPIKPKELTKRYKRKITSTLDFLEKKLPNVKDDYTEPILTVSGTNAIHSKIIEIIKSASKEIFIEVWSQDFKYFENYLFDAYNRGLDIKIVGYDNFSCNFGTVFCHAGGREIEYSLGGKMIFLAADNTEGIFGKTQTNKGDNSHIIWTKNEDIVFLIKEFIVHDMYLIDIEEQFPEQLKYFYGKGMKKLKDKVLGGNGFYKIH
ncbi:MAG: TrmB family transcriptional regulator [Brachyspira sp.]|jgi:uncharacterized protein yrhO|nr:TrmB family transcriptional regulator [Brachyspira sp.]CCY23919.1 transcriptional regulator TrmB [Brachyspira sp. CAG:484]